MRRMSNVDFLTTADVADRLGVSVRQVARMVDSGALRPAVKLPGLRGPFLFSEATISAAQAEA